MARTRYLPPVVRAPTHDRGEQDCVVMNTNAIHTVTLPEGAFVAVVTDNGELASIAVMDADEVEAHIQLLQNAVADARRIDAGLPPIARASKGSTH